MIQSVAERVQKNGPDKIELLRGPGRDLIMHEQTLPAHAGLVQTALQIGPQFIHQRSETGILVSEAHFLIFTHDRLIVFMLLPKAFDQLQKVGFDVLPGFLAAGEQTVLHRMKGLSQGRKSQGPRFAFPGMELAHGGLIEFSGDAEGC